MHQLEFIILLEAYKCLGKKFKMPKATKKSNLVETTSDNEYQADSNLSNESSSADQEVFLNPQPSTSNKDKEVQSMNMHMPYIEGPSMDWTVNDNLYNRFLKWKLKSENILECELAMLSETRKCKKVLAWSGDFGLDQYISWNLPNEELTLEVIWKKIWKILQTSRKWGDGKIWSINQL